MTSKWEKNVPKYFTIEEAVDNLGFGLFQWRILFIVGFHHLADACEILLLSLLAPVLRCEWLLSDWQVALISTVVFGGMIIFSPIWGSLGDLLGRKPIAFIVAVFTFYFGILTSLSPTYLWILILRGLVGAGYAGTPQAYGLLTEYLPKRFRAKVLLSHVLFWAVGGCFEVALAMAVIPRLGWRWLIAFSGLPSAISILTFWFLPESARFLLASGHRSKALKILEKIASINKCKLPEGILQQPTQVPRGRLVDLFSKFYRRITLQLWIIAFITAFCYYGIILLNAELIRMGKTCKSGLNTKMSTKHLDTPCMCNPLTSQNYLLLLIPTTGEFVAYFLNMIFIDVFGRRKTIAFNLSVAGLFYFLLNFCKTDVTRTMFILVIRSFCATCINANSVYSGEVYPTVIRALGLSSVNAWARVGAMTTTLVSQMILHQSGLITTLIYGGLSLSGAIVALLLPVETKGQDLKDTDVALQQHTCHPDLVSKNGNALTITSI